MSAPHCVAVMDFDLEIDAFANDCPDIVTQMAKGAKVAKMEGEPSSASAAPKGKAKAKAKSKGPAVVKTCFILTCDDECVKSKRWCKKHNQTFDNMFYQAKKENEIESLETAMSNPETATEAMEEFDEENPSEGKWRRKKLIVWIPVIEEKHSDKDRSKSVYLEEGGVQEKQLNAEDRRVLLQQCKGNMRGRDIDGFFNEDAADAAAEATTPPAKGKRALEESGEKVETPAEKKARMKFEKLASSGPAFTAFKTTACNKVLDKLGLCSKAAENAKKKLEEARKSVREYLAPNSSEQDAVALSYQSCLEACEAALRCWEVDMPSPSDADREKALDDLKKALESVGPDVKLVKSDASLMPSVYFTCRAHGLKNLTDAKEVSDMQTTLIKTELATVDLFMKALLKISSDVQSYLKQKKTSQERADARKKRQQEADEAVKMREAAKNAAAKARMFSKLSHPIFGIKDSCWKPFVVHSGQGFDPAAHADEPWVMRASEAV